MPLRGANNLNESERGELQKKNYTRLFHSFNWSRSAVFCAQTTCVSIYLSVGLSTTTASLGSPFDMRIADIRLPHTLDLLLTKVINVQLYKFLYITNVLIYILLCVLHFHAR